MSQMLIDLRQLLDDILKQMREHVESAGFVVGTIPAGKSEADIEHDTNAIDLIGLTDNGISELLCGVYPSNDYGSIRKLVKLAINQLLLDGYIQLVRKEPNVISIDRHIITVKGWLFISEGGYGQEYKSLAEERTRLIDVDEAAKRNANRLNYLTALLFVSTGLLAASEGIKLNREHRQNLCLYIEILVALAVLSLLILLWHQRKQNKTSNSRH